MSRQVNWSGRNLCFFTNASSLKSLSVFVEFQRVRPVRTTTLRLQIRPWFIAPLFALLFPAKPPSSLSGVSWLIMRSTRRSLKCGSFFRPFSHRHLKIDLVEELFNTFVITVATYRMIWKLRARGLLDTFFLHSMCISL